MGLGCLNPGKCGCNICWDCPLPLSYSISCADACFDQLNGTHALSPGDFSEPSCSSEVSLSRQELYLWEYVNPAWAYQPGSSLNSGDHLYVSMCDGSLLDATANPQPADPFVTTQTPLQNMLYSASRGINLISPSTVRVTLVYGIARQVVLEHDGTIPVSPHQRIYSRDRQYTYVFEKSLTGCADASLTPISTSVVISTKGWGLGNPDPDLGALSTVASDFTVSVNMP